MFKKYLIPLALLFNVFCVKAQLVDLEVVTDTNEVLLGQSTNIFASNSIPFNAAVNASSPTIVTNFTFISPMQYGAVGNGIANDTLALSNSVTAMNAGNILVWDGQGQTYYITSGVAWTRGHIEIRNATIVVPSNFVGSVFIHSQSIQGQLGNGAYYHGLTIERQGTNAPDPSVVGIQNGVLGFSYFEDLKTEFVHFSNLWRNVEIINTPQFDIRHCMMGNCWSNKVYVAQSVAQSQTSSEGGDESIITLNDMNTLDDNNSSPTSVVDSQRHNCIDIQLDAYCIHLEVSYNNGGSDKQAFKVSPWVGGSTIFFRGGEYEGMFASYPTNLCQFEIWNSVVHFEDCHIAGNGVFGTSNYLAAIGLYATNGQHISFRSDTFTGQLPNETNVFDIWTADGFMGNIDFLQYPQYLSANTCGFTWHTNLNDVGVNYPIQGTVPAVISGTNTVVWAPGQGTVTIGAAGCMVAVNENGVGQYCTFGNSANFNNGFLSLGNAYFNNGVTENGGRPDMSVNAPYSHVLDFFVQSSGLSDSHWVNGTNWVADVVDYTNQANVFAGSIGILGTNQATMTSTGYTNNNTYDVRVFNLQGTTIIFSNNVSTANAIIGTIAVNNDFLTLHPHEMLYGTGMTGSIIQ
jgi:hypothetical protein